MLRGIILMVTVSVLFAGGCSAEGDRAGRKEGSTAVDTMQAQGGSKLPEGHPAVNTGGGIMIKHGGVKTQRQVVVSEEVRARWKSVELEITDRKLNTKDIVKVEIGKEIPPQLYQAVAEILAYVYQLNQEKLRRVSQQLGPAFS